MDLALVLIVFGGTGLVVLGTGAAALVYTSVTHVERWSFGYLGRRIEIRAYHPLTRLGGASLGSEQVLVDGAAATTERDGHSGPYVRHVLRLDNDRTLRIWIRAGGVRLGDPEGWAGCLVDDGARVIFTSDAPPRPEIESAWEVDDDPRLAAARVLLADLAGLDERAAGDLEVAVERLLAAERDAVYRAAAHAALGGDGEELVARRASEVEDLLRALRELHLAVTRRDAEATKVAKRALARLGAVHEVR